MDNKKKKNRKKKGNQSKVTEDATTHFEDIAALELGNGYVPEENHSAHNSVCTDIQSAGMSESDMEYKHKTDEANCLKLQEEIRQLEDERSLWLQKQVSLEEKIEVLQKELNLFSQKEAILEEKIKDFQMGNDSLFYKQAILEDKVKNIDGIRDSLILKEASLKEMIARVEETSISLQMQVKELEGAGKCTVEENQQLLERIILMESRILHLEKDASSRGILIEKMTKLFDTEVSVEKLWEDAVGRKQSAENADPVRNDLQVGEPYNGSEEYGATAERSSIESNHVNMSDEASSPTNYILKYDGGKMAESGERLMSDGVQEIGVKNAGNGFVSETLVRSGPPLGADGPRISEEIVTVPLDEIQIHEDESRGVKNEEISDEIPLSDAPLIGAPFRFISFVARYVSGDDLVNHADSKSGRRAFSN